MDTKKYIILFLYVSVICVFAGSTVADTVIPYTLTNGWTYEAVDWTTLVLTENPPSGIIASIDIPTGIDDGGLQTSRHDVVGYSLHNGGFIQLEYSSLSSVITGNPEGLDLCLELEFSDAGNIFYEIGMEVWQCSGGYSFETWFDVAGGGPYYKTPVPDGISVAEGALGLYNNGSLIFPYFIDAAGSVVSPFVVWNISGITGTKDYRVDNEFEGSTTAGGTITASVNLVKVVHGPGNPFTIEPLSGGIYMPPGVPNIGYSLDEADLLYFFSYGPVLNYNFTTGLWDTEGPEGFLYVAWPFIYELDTGHLWFALPPVNGLWVYHFSTSQWLISPRIIPW